MPSNRSECFSVTLTDISHLTPFKAGCFAVNTHAHPPPHTATCLLLSLPTPVSSWDAWWQLLGAMVSFWPRQSPEDQESTLFQSYQWPSPPQLHLCPPPPAHECSPSTQWGAGCPQESLLRGWGRGRVPTTTRSI